MVRLRKGMNKMNVGLKRKMSLKLINFIWPVFLHNSCFELMYKKCTCKTLILQVYEKNKALLKPHCTIKNTSICNMKIIFNENKFVLPKNCVLNQSLLNQSLSCFQG